MTDFNPELREPTEEELKAYEDLYRDKKSPPLGYLYIGPDLIAIEDLRYRPVRRLSWSLIIFATGLIIGFFLGTIA